MNCNNDGSAFKFSHPREYRIVAVAGRGAFAAVCKADVLDDELARGLGLLPEQSLSRQATTMSGQYSSDVVQDAAGMAAQHTTSSSDNATVLMPVQVSPLQQLQRQASAALAECPSAGFAEAGVFDDDADNAAEPGSVTGPLRRRSNAGTPPPPPSAAAAATAAGAADTDDTVKTAPAVTASTEGDLAPSFGAVAIKQLIDVASVSRACSESWGLHYLRKVCREVEIIRHFKNVPQIINVGDVYLSNDECDLYIVMPFVEHNLRQIVEVYPLEEELIRWIMCQLLIGLDVLHTSDVVHRDLTLANVLVDGETWDTHIADFGLSRARESADKEISLDVVTLPYRAPELLLEYTKYDNTIDIWAFGCIMAEAFLQAPFLYVDQTKSNPDSFKQLKQVLKFTGFPDVERVASMASLANTNFLRNWATQLGDKAPRGRDIGDLLRERRPGLAISEEAVEVLRDALQFEPSRRLPAKELLAKPWFRNNADCAGLIDMCLNLPQPGPCPTQVEHMDRDQLRAFLKDQSLGRRANVDSYVAELSK